MVEVRRECSRHRVARSGLRGENLFNVEAGHRLKRTRPDRQTQSNDSRGCGPELSIHPMTSSPSFTRN